MQWLIGATDSIREATCPVLYVPIWECCPTQAKTGRQGTMALLRRCVTCRRCRALFTSMKARLGNQGLARTGDTRRTSHTAVIGFYLLSCHLIDLTLGRTFCSSPLHSPPTVIGALREVKRNIQEEGKAMSTRTRTFGECQVPTLRRLLDNFV